MHLEPQGIRVSCLIPGPVATDIMASMTNWTQDCPLRGPGEELTIMMPAQVAEVLADGMADGRILISSDDSVWAIVRRWAADPDAFIRDKIHAFRRGGRGRPQVPEVMLQELAKSR